AFIRRLGGAYSASGRHKRLFDTVAHHPYGESPTESPTARHSDGTIGEGDWQQLMNAYFDGFARTPQPMPGQDGVTIWYLEDGFQTAVDSAKRQSYSGSENAPAVAPAAQASQIIGAISLAYCQPYVGAFLNFQLWDDQSLAGWQSGAYWADGTPKPSLAA